MMAEVIEPNFDGVGAEDQLAISGEVGSGHLEITACGALGQRALPDALGSGSLFDDCQGIHPRLGDFLDLATGPRDL